MATAEDIGQQTESGKARESNILELSEGLMRLTEELRGILNNRFDRAPPTDVKEEPRPITANVLDEITSNLNSSSSQLAGVNSFLLTTVLPKIN